MSAKQARTEDMKSVKVTFEQNHGVYLHFLPLLKAKIEDAKLLVNGIYSRLMHERLIMNKKKIGKLRHELQSDVFNVKPIIENFDKEIQILDVRGYVDGLKQNYEEQLQSNISKIKEYPDKNEPLDEAERQKDADKFKLMRTLYVTQNQIFDEISTSLNSLKVDYANLSNYIKHGIIDGNPVDGDIIMSNKDNKVLNDDEIVALVGTTLSEENNQPIQSKNRRGKKVKKDEKGEKGEKDVPFEGKTSSSSVDFDPSIPALSTGIVNAEGVKEFTLQQGDETNITDLFKTTYTNDEPIATRILAQIYASIDLISQMVEGVLPGDHETMGMGVYTLSEIRNNDLYLTFYYIRKSEFNEFAGKPVEEKKQFQICHVSFHGEKEGLAPVINFKLGSKGCALFNVEEPTYDEYQLFIVKETSGKKYFDLRIRGSVGKVNELEMKVIECILFVLNNCLPDFLISQNLGGNKRRTRRRMKLVQKRVTKRYKRTIKSKKRRDSKKKRITKKRRC